jgi:ABC-type branched-subunit amino acid transport system ATPase component
MNSDVVDVVTREHRGDRRVASCSEKRATFPNITCDEDVQAKLKRGNSEIQTKSLENMVVADK